MNHIAIFQVAKFDVRENQIDEERNQESRPEEKGPRKKEEVAFGRARKGDSQNQKHFKAPVSGAFFIVSDFSLRNSRPLPAASQTHPKCGARTSCGPRSHSRGRRFRCESESAHTSVNAEARVPGPR